MLFFFLLQGASSTFPSFYCDIIQSKLKNHKEEKHNFETVKCNLRNFDKMKEHLLKQIANVSDYKGRLDIDEFFHWVKINERNDVERQFRDKGKHNQSVIGKVNSCVDSMEYALGGELHNEIGVGNDCIEMLFKDLENQKMEHISTLLKVFLDSPKSEEGAGCTPGQHHGGQFNGKNIKFIYESLACGTLDLFFLWLYNHRVYMEI